MVRHLSSRYGLVTVFLRHLRWILYQPDNYSFFLSLWPCLSFSNFLCLDSFTSYQATLLKVNHRSEKSPKNYCELFTWNPCQVPTFYSSFRLPLFLFICLSLFFCSNWAVFYCCSLLSFFTLLSFSCLYYLFVSSLFFLFF